MLLSAMVRKKRDVRTYSEYLRLVWESIQVEIDQFWAASPIKISDVNRALTEDSRLLIVAYCLIQSERPESVFLAVKTV